MGKEKPEVLAIIPARGGSRGIPRKNIVDLCGKPLIAYTIDAALKSTAITRVVVSTEDEEIAEISKQYGAEVPFLRPKELAEDRSSIGDAVTYSVRRLSEDGFVPDIVVELYPTHLFRNPRLIDFLISKSSEGYRTVKTVRPIQLSPMSLFSMNGDDSLVPLLTPDTNGDRGQSSIFFRSYGLFIGANRKAPHPFGIYLHRVTDPISLIDIDSYADLHMAKEIIRRKLFAFDLR
jgi:CMP-N-acetylneuraminic acid synthetase